MIKLRMVHRLRDERELDLCAAPLFAIEHTVITTPGDPRWPEDVRVMVPWCPVHGVVSITETASCSVSPHQDE